MKRIILVTLAAMLGVGATARLGVWQLDRAAQKEALQSRREAQQRLTPLPMAELAHASLDRLIRLRGTWLPQHVVYLDNRPMNGKVGFYVLMPLQLEGQNPPALVMRGWVQRDFMQREHLRPLVTPTGVVEVIGRVAKGPAVLYEFKHESKHDGKGGDNQELSKIRQNLLVTDYAVETGLPLWQGSVVQTSAEDDGLLRDWPAPHTGIDKHYGYAFQWFGLCALIAILYVWFQIIPYFRRRQTPRVDGA